MGCRLLFLHSAGCCQEPRLSPEIWPCSHTAWGGHRKAHQKALHVTHVCDLESMHVLPNQNLANWVVDSCGCSLNSR